MNKILIKNQIISFIIMLIVGVLFNPMNILAYKFSDLYISLTLLYSGLLMASNMIWAHEIIHYLNIGKMNTTILLIGISLSLIMTIILRNQMFVNDKQWLKRMIGHHSTAITTTNKLLKKKNIIQTNPKLYRLAKGIIYNQEKEILYMKSLLF